MPRALRDMQPWRRAIAEAGLTFPEVAEATGVTRDAVESYSMGRRTPTDAWVAKVLALAAAANAESERATA